MTEQIMTKLAVQETAIHARIFINVPAWNGGFDIEMDCVAAV